MVSLLLVRVLLAASSSLQCIVPTIEDTSLLCVLGLGEYKIEILEDEDRACAVSTWPVDITLY